MKSKPIHERSSHHGAPVTAADMFRTVADYTYD